MISCKTKQYKYSFLDVIKAHTQGTKRVMVGSCAITIRHWANGEGVARKVTSTNIWVSIQSVESPPQNA